jgi:predicted aminopeptidase
MRKWIKKWPGKIALVVFLMLITLGIYHRELVLYGIRQGIGQMSIIWKAKPVFVYLQDPVFPDSLKYKLRLIEQVRQFAIDSLGLKDSQNYKTLYDQKGEEIMWVVTASEPFALVAREWRFPVVGSVPYKGYFNKDLAMQEKAMLEAEGWDVSVRNPGGWSTLGWFTDPILSGMLMRNAGDLASLIIHEMVHATLFVRDSVEFNENLASFIGDRGAEYFLLSAFGAESNEYITYIEEDRDYNRYVDHMLRGCDFLDSLYLSIQHLPPAEKIQKKEDGIRSIMRSLDTLNLSTMPVALKKLTLSLPNNAYFMSFRRYQSRQDDFWEEYQAHFKGNLKAYIKAMIERHPFR